MATKSDFAQKLLHDLRLRKERMAAPENSTRNSGPTSRGGAYRGAQQINALESAASRIANSSRRSKGTNRSMHFEEPSNQIILYGQGQKSTQVRDLSMAIAFAFENSGKLSKITASSSNPLVNFFNRFTRRSMGTQKVDNTNFDHGSQLATVSHINTTEISRGVQKLNEILRGYSNGMNFDRDSINIGKELLKGARDLEEALRMLVNLQEASEHMTGTGRQKGRIKLLEEGEEEEDQGYTEKTVQKWQLDRPRFSFDKSSKNAHVVQDEARNSSKRQPLPASSLNETFKQVGGNSKMVPHKRSASCVEDLSLATQVKPKDLSGSSHLTQEKGRLSNVIAKLMGLEELPQKEESIRKQNDFKGNEGKQGKTSSKSSKVVESLNRETLKGPLLGTDKKSVLTSKPSETRDMKQGPKFENYQGTPERDSKIASSDTSRPWKDSKLLAVDIDARSSPRVAVSVAHKQQSHAIAASQIKGPQTAQDTERKQNVPQDRERNIMETKQIFVSNNELQQNAQNSKRLKTEDIGRTRTKSKVNVNHLEKRNAKKDLRSNQRKPQDQEIPIQVQVTEKHEELCGRHQTEPKIQQLQKQILQAKNQENYQVESTVSSKPKKISMVKLEKRISHDKSTPGNGEFTKPDEKVPVEYPENSKHHHDAPITKNTSTNQEIFKKEDQNHISSQSEQKFAKENGSNIKVSMQEKPSDGSATNRKAISRKVQKSENPRKIDVMLSRKNPNANRLSRSLKQPTNIIQDLKQQMHNKNRSSKRIEQQRDSKAEGGESGEIMSNASEMISQTPKEPEKLQIHVEAAEQTIPLNSSLGDECTTENILDTSVQDDQIDNTSKSGQASDNRQQEELPYHLEDEQEPVQRDTRTGDHGESSELTPSQTEYGQFPASLRLEQLTESEMDLKEIIIKNQSFLNTAEALFKLNTPASFLHAVDQNDEILDKKLIVDCGCEIMKRKARRHEIARHPYTNLSTHCAKISSLDDLVKQLHKDLETLKFYGGNGSDECDAAESLHKMLNRDIYNTNPDVNIMWDSQWTSMMSMFPEKEEIVKDVEKHMLNRLLDEITNDQVGFVVEQTLNMKF